MLMSIKRYSELSKLKTFNERYSYLKLGGAVGKDTFGFDRYLNQVFYKDRGWLSVRDFVIVRDCGCDMGLDGYNINGRIIIHHMNPITVDDIKTRSEFLLDPEYLIAVSHDTHNAIHYGDDSFLFEPFIERVKNDTCPWRHC